MERTREREDSFLVFLSYNMEETPLPCFLVWTSRVHDSAVPLTDMEKLEREVFSCEDD